MDHNDDDADVIFVSSHGPIENLPTYYDPSTGQHFCYGLSFWLLSKKQIFNKMLIFKMLLVLNSYMISSALCLVYTSFDIYYMAKN